MNQRELCCEYETILLGKRRNFPGSFWEQGEVESRENAIVLFRYAIEKILNWTPLDVKNALTPEIIDMLKLTVVMKYMNITGEYDLGFNSHYIAHLLYPTIIPYDSAQVTLSIFKNVLKNGSGAYPKKFFHDEAGVYRARICLSYVLRNELLFSSIQDVYKCFASSEGIRIINKYHLSAAAPLFETPIDFLHQSLSETQRNPFWYNYYKFQVLYREQRRLYKENEL